MALDTAYVDELKGLDALEAVEEHDNVGKRLWDGTWPKVAAVGLFVAFWQVVVWLRLKPEYVLPAPTTAMKEFATQLTQPTFWQATSVTLTRGVVGFLIASVIGLALGVVVARSRILRTALGSLITGLQTMPSIAWFPLAILLFQLSEQAILFVILIGAVPSIANGVISGVDYVPPLLVRAGRNLGATRLRALPSHRHPRGTAEHRLRAQAGLGVRLALPARRRAHRRHRQPAQPRRLPVQQPRAGRAGLHARADDRHPAHRRTRRHRLHQHRQRHPAQARRSRQHLSAACPR